MIEKQNISAKELHPKAGYTEAAISKYRTGKQFTPLDFFFELKKLNDISIDDFLSKKISRGDIRSQMPQSAVQQTEEALYPSSAKHILFTISTQAITKEEIRILQKNLFFMASFPFQKIKLLLISRTTATLQFLESRIALKQQDSRRQLINWRATRTLKNTFLLMKLRH